MLQHSQEAYIHADRAISHYTRLLSGAGLSERDRRMFRVLLIRAVFVRAAARERLEQRAEVAA